VGAEEKSFSLSKNFARYQRATAREPDTALAALKTGKILLTHATPNTGGAVDHLIVPEV
jgi:hypothetical protein